MAEAGNLYLVGSGHDGELGRRGHLSEMGLKRLFLLAQQLRRLDQLPDYLEGADDVLAHYGLEKFPQPVLVAGALAWRGERLKQEPYVGLAPEVASAVTAAGAVSGILTIENLASFNRHVREARGDGEIVIYSGGFPSRHTLAFIHRLAAESEAPCFHWGDIDLGGIRIAHHLHQALPRGLRLHLMSEELALAHGTPVDPIRASGIPADSPVADLAAFLGLSEPAAWSRKSSTRSPSLIPSASIPLE